MAFWFIIVLIKAFVRTVTGCIFDVLDSACFVNVGHCYNDRIDEVPNKAFCDEAMGNAGAVTDGEEEVLVTFNTADGETVCCPRYFHWCSMHDIIANVSSYLLQCCWNARLVLHECKGRDHIEQDHQPVGILLRHLHRGSSRDIKKIVSQGKALFE